MERARIVVVATVVVLALLTVGAGRRRAVRPPGPPTFNLQIVRILQQRCQPCHHEGGIAPFALVDYEDVWERSGLVRLMVESRRMPPWKAAEGCGKFLGERRLSDAEIATIVEWVDSGAAEGDPGDLPNPLVFDEEWTLGAPDLVLANEVTYTPPSEKEAYRCFSIPTGLLADRWVKSIDVRPGDRKAVHHVIPYVDRSGVSRILDSVTPEPGYECFGGPGFVTTELLGGWSPGATPTTLPHGTAVLLPANSRVVMQVHYSPYFGVPEPDRTELGLYFAEEEITKQLRYSFVLEDSFAIPPGEEDYLVVAERGVPPIPATRPLELVSVYPHMHLLGKSIRVLRVDGDETSCLIDIPAYEFDWQQNYVYSQPRSLPAGTRLRVECHFDNSSSNPNNPNAPPKTVRWGEESTDEMCLALVGYTLE